MKKLSQAQREKKKLKWNKTEEQKKNISSTNTAILSNTNTERSVERERRDEIHL